MSDEYLAGRQVNVPMVKAAIGEMRRKLDLASQPKSQLGSSDLLLASA